MTATRNILVLAGTADARKAISALATDSRFAITASLAGVTPSPIALPVPVHNGGFGGAAGLADYCKVNAVDLILDITHPFARHISYNARKAAAAVGIRCLAYDRPPWPLEAGWKEFDSWEDMVAAVPSGERVFLAGGTASIDAFTKRDDLYLCARALNVEGRVNGAQTHYLNAMPNASIEDEAALFEAHSITLLCCKNSGGKASSAKLGAAHKLGIPVWMLGRHKIDNRSENIEIFDNLDDLIAVVKSEKECQHG